MPLIVRRAERRNGGGRRVFICSCSNGFSARDCAGPRGHTVKGVGEESEGSRMAAGRGEKAAEDRGPDIRLGAQGRACGWGWTGMGVLGRRKGTGGREERA